MLSVFWKQLWPLYAVSTIPSKKNGVIKVEKWFLKYNVSVDGTYQSGTYTNGIFKVMCSFLPKKFHPKRILLLGLGAGGWIPELQKRFPDAHLTVLEYDNVMVEIAQKTYLPRTQRQKIEIIVGDICETMPELTPAFDVVFVDVFCGDRVSPALTSPQVMQSLKRLLSWEGYVLVNFFKEYKQILPIIESHLALHGNKRYLSNSVGAFQHYGKGKMGEGLPEGFKDREQSRGYLSVITSKDRHSTIIEDPSGLGVRTKIGPWIFDRFVTPHPPDLSRFSIPRSIVWQPYTGTRFPGWIRIPEMLCVHYKRGVAIIDSQDYWRVWSRHAQRHRKKFAQDETYEVIQVDVETFGQAYHATKALDWLTRKKFLDVLRVHLSMRPQDVYLSVVRRKQDGCLVAGLATTDYKDISQSVHMIAFIHPQAQHTSVGVGLIDDWYQRCLTQQIRFANFGLLRRSCDPRSWNGYTNFKKQFHLYEMLYPQPVFRIILPCWKNPFSARTL